MNKIDHFIKNAISCGSFSFDVEHDPKYNRHKSNFEIVGCGFSTKEITFFENDIESITEICKTLFEKIESIAYNAKYDLQCLVAAKLITEKEYPKYLVDPMIGINLLDDNLRPNQLSLKAVVECRYGYEMKTFEKAWAFGQESDQFLTYACDDARYEWQLWQDIKPELEKQDLLPLFEKILMPAVKVFADMEMCGIKWNLDDVRSLLTGYQELRDTIKSEILNELGPLNLNSGDQLAKRLFEDLGYSTYGVEQTKSGKRYSVDAKAMDVLAKRYPVCKKIKIYRTAEKMIGTYLSPLTEMASDDEKSRIHPTFWLVSATGRTRAEKPNLQNQPAHLDKAFKDLNIRNLFIAEEGRKLIVSDYSQLELRLIAHITKDPNLLKAYRKWKCKRCGRSGMDSLILHDCPFCGAEENEVDGFWHGLDLHQMTADKVTALDGDRAYAKQANFALVYYATARKMNYEYPKFSVGQWQDVIDEFFDAYPKVREWHMRMERCLYTSRTCVDIFGRKRRILKQNIINNPKNALNMLINFSPQSSGCGMVELAMAKLRDHWIEEDIWLKGVYPVLMVHDEIVYEVDEKLIDKVIVVIREYMEHVVTLLVPLRVDIKVVKRWGEAK